MLPSHSNAGTDVPKDALFPLYPLPLRPPFISTPILPLHHVLHVHRCFSPPSMGRNLSHCHFASAKCTHEAQPTLLLSSPRAPSSPHHDPQLRQSAVISSGSAASPPLPPPLRRRARDFSPLRHGARSASSLPQHGALHEAGLPHNGQVCVCERETERERERDRG